jgi:O-antigen ligase
MRSRNAMNYSRARNQTCNPAGAGDRRTFFVFFTAVGLGVAALGIAIAFGPFVALALPLAIAVLAAAVRDYRVASWIVVFMLPIAPTYLIPREAIGISGANVMLALVLIAVSSLVLTYAIHPRRFALPSWPRAFFLYLAVFAAAAFHGAFSADEIPDFYIALNVVTSTSIPTYLQVTLLNPSVALGAAAVVSIAIRNARRPALYLVPIFCSAIVFACAVLFVAMTSGSSLNDLASQESREFLSGTGLHANELGLLLNTAWALSLFTFMHTRRLSARIALGAVAALVAIGVMLTFSRGAYLGFLTVGAYLLFVQRKFLLILSAAILIPLAATVLPDSVTHRATHEVNSNDVDALSSGRVDEIWEPLLPELARSPLVGNGIGSIMWSDAARQQRILPVGHPHSAYLAALLDLGVLGTVVVLGFFVHMWRLFARLGARAPERLWRGFFNGAAASILVIFVQGATDDSFLPGRTQSFVWLAYGIAIGYRARLRALQRAGQARIAKPGPISTAKALTR